MKKYIFLSALCLAICFQSDAAFQWNQAGHNNCWSDGHIILNTERLYRVLRLDIDTVISTVNNMLNIQTGWNASGAPRNILRDHIVMKGHFGFIPIPALSDPRGEDKGFIKSHRIDTNEPRSFFYPSAELQQRLHKYQLIINPYIQACNSIANKLILLTPSAKNANPGPGMTNRDHFVRYTEVKNQMTEEADAFIQALRENKYLASEMDYDEETDTIRVKAIRNTAQAVNAPAMATPATIVPAAPVGAVPHAPVQGVQTVWDMRNGKQPNNDMNGYIDTNGDIFIYIQIKSDKKLAITSIFPGTNWDALNTRQNLQVFGNAAIPYINNPAIVP